MNPRNNKDSFWSTVNKLLGPIPKHLPRLGRCWVWTGTTSYGYGVTRYADRMHQAHRLSWFFTHGKWPKPCCLHKCDNSLCVRPSHLFEGTVLDNNLDKLKKGRQARGEKVGGSRLLSNDVLRIRKMYKQGSTQVLLAYLFKVTQANISEIVLRKSWRHL